MTITLSPRVRVPQTMTKLVAGCLLIVLGFVACNKPPPKLTPALVPAPQLPPPAATGTAASLESRLAQLEQYVTKGSPPLNEREISPRLQAAAVAEMKSRDPKATLRASTIMYSEPALATVRIPFTKGNDGRIWQQDIIYMYQAGSWRSTWLPPAAMIAEAGEKALK